MRRASPVVVHGRLWRGCFFGAVGLALLTAAPVCGSGEQNPTPPATAGASALVPTAQPSATTTPEATPEAAAFPTAVFPTPASAADAMIVGGTLWVDARPAVGEVLALIGGKECGHGQSGRMQSEPPSSIAEFVIVIASDGEEPGCGVPGAPITITLDGRAMNDTISWQPGYQQPVNLVAGPAFATYYGRLRVNTALTRFSVVPYVDGVPCGGDLGPGGLMGQETEIHYNVLVDPAELLPGCGRDGVEVEFHLQIEGQADIVFDTAPWSAGLGNQRPTLDLSGRIPKSPLPATAVSQ